MNLFPSGLILSELLDSDPMPPAPGPLIQDCTPAASDPSPHPRFDAPTPENHPDTSDFRRIFESESAREASVAAAASDLERKFEFPSSSDWRILFVGGTRFETTVKTLSTDTGSMLSALLRTHPEQVEHRIDRDGRRFEHVLNYLRSGTIYLEDLPALQGIHEEAEFFNLPGLLQLCEERILEVERKQAQERSRRSQELTEALIEAFFRDSHSASFKRPAPIRARRLGDPPLATPRFDLDADF